MQKNELIYYLLPVLLMTLVKTVIHSNWGTALAEHFMY